MLKITIFFLILAIIFSSFNLSFALENQQESKNLCRFTRDLRVGSKGEDVKCLQEYLKELNLFNHQSTGYYGISTKRAVLKWQEINDLLPTGIFDLNSRIKYHFLVNSKKNKLNSKEKEYFLMRENTKSLFNISIEDEDIIVDSNAPKDIGIYLRDFTLKISESENYKNIVKKIFAFSYETNTIAVDNTKSLFKIEESLIPGFFVEDNLKFNVQEKEKLKEKTSLLKEMLELQVEERSKTAVHPDIKNIHKLFIVTDSLGIELLNKFLDYIDNKIDEKEIKLYLDDYNREINKKRKEAINEVFKISKKTNSFEAVLYKIISNIFLFLPKQVLAQMSFFLSPFGGQIIEVDFCSVVCPFAPIGFRLTIGPPVLTNLFVPFYFLSSPLFFMYRNIWLPGIWVLGLRTYIPVYCVKKCSWKSGGIFGAGRWISEFLPIHFQVFEMGTGLVPSLF